MDVLKGKTILVGVSGGIAAYKVCGLVSALVKSGATVHVMMTRNATEFVAPLSFESLSHNRVVTDTFDRNFTWEVEHVSLAKKADAAIIAPATANVIAKLACGIADDFLTTTILACKCPVVFAPAMNTAMLENQITAQNIAALEKRGFISVYGESGYLACGDSGNGRMAEPETILNRVEAIFARKSDYVGKTVVVTSGATRLPIDPVRFLSNRSSGKMGYNIALAAYERGANVVYIRGFTDKFAIPREWTDIHTPTTADMLEAVKRYKAADAFVMAAAPCDYEVVYAPQKIKAQELNLTLKKTADIAKWVGANKRNDARLVIFAAETDNCVKNARSKLVSKKADMVVLNDVTAKGAGFEVDTNIATLITKDSELELGLMSKRELADRILDNIAL